MRPFLLYLHLILLLSSLLTPLASVFSIKNDRLSRLKRETATEEPEMSFEEMETKYNNMTATLKNYSQEIEETKKIVDEAIASMAELNRTADAMKKDHLEKERIKAEKNKPTEEFEEQQRNEEEAQNKLDNAKIGLVFTANTVSKEIEAVEKEYNKTKAEKEAAIKTVNLKESELITLNGKKNTTSKAFQIVKPKYKGVEQKIEQQHCEEQLNRDTEKCKELLSTKADYIGKEHAYNNAVQAVKWAISNITKAKNDRDDADLSLIRISQELNKKKEVKQLEEELDKEKRLTLEKKRIKESNPVDIFKEDEAVNDAYHKKNKAENAIKEALETIKTKTALLESLNKNKDKLEEELKPLEIEYEAEKQKREKSAEASFPFFVFVIIGLILLLSVLAIFYFLWYKKKSQQKKNPDPTVLLESGTVQTSTKRNSAKVSATETKDTDPSKVNNSSGSDQQDVQRQKVEVPVQQAIDNKDQPQTKVRIEKKTEAEKVSKGSALGCLIPKKKRKEVVKTDKTTTTRNSENVSATKTKTGSAERNVQRQKTQTPVHTAGTTPAVVSTQRTANSATPVKGTTPAAVSTQNTANSATPVKEAKQTPMTELIPKKVVNARTAEERLETMPYRVKRNFDKLRDREAPVMANPYNQVDVSCRAEKNSMQRIITLIAKGSVEVTVQPSSEFVYLCKAVKKILKENRVPANQVFVPHEPYEHDPSRTNHNPLIHEKISHTRFPDNFKETPVEKLDIEKLLEEMKLFLEKEETAKEKGIPFEPKNNPFYDYCLYSSRLRTGEKIDLTAEFILFVLKYMLRFYEKGGPSVVSAPTKTVIVGDIHGSLSSLNKVFSLCDTEEWPGFMNYNFVFLGDFVDRGEKSLEVMMSLLILKILRPNSIFLCRGNHEIGSVNKVYGLHGECMSRFPEDGQEIYDEFNKCFQYLPLMVIIDRRILCCHGGFNPLNTLSEIRTVRLPLKHITSSQAAEDVLWSDPMLNLLRVIFNIKRGSGKFIGSGDVISFLEKARLQLVVRGHQCPLNGFIFFAEYHLMTTFASENYEGDKNWGSCVLVEGDKIFIKTFSEGEVISEEKMRAIFDYHFMNCPVHQVNLDEGLIEHTKKYGSNGTEGTNIPAGCEDTVAEVSTRTDSKNEKKISNGKNKKAVQT